MMEALWETVALTGLVMFAWTAMVAGIIIKAYRQGSR